MKNLFLLTIIPLCLFIACSDDNNPTSDELLKQKLIDVGEWENYGYYIIERGIPNNDTTWIPHYEDAWHWTFEQSSYTIKKDDDLLKLNYWIKNDSIYSQEIKSDPNTSADNILFKGDSCILSSSFNSANKKSEHVLYPKGYKK